MIYERYDRLCQHRRGLISLVSDKSYSVSDRHRFLNEIKRLNSVIRRWEAVLSIQVEGDWEFSNLAYNFTFYPPERDKILAIEKATRSKWEAVVTSAQRHKATKEYMKKYHRERRAKIAADPVKLEAERKWRREYMKRWNANRK